MKCSMVENLVHDWLRKLRFHEWWVVSFGVEVSGTWHDANQRVVEWKVDLDELNREVCICVTIGLGLDDEYTINLDFDFEYIIVYSLLQIIHDIDDCDCELLHNKTATLLGRRMTECILPYHNSFRVVPQKISDFQ